MRNYYTYSLIDPSTNKPFYFGKGQDQRMYEHVKAVSRGRIPNGNNHLHNKIRKILGQENEIKYDVLCESKNEKICLIIEEFAIKYHGIENLCNLTMGGESCVHSEETRRKMSKSHKGIGLSDETKLRMSIARRGEKHHMFGKKHTDASKRKMSEIKKGKFVTDETRKKMSKAAKGRIVSEETKRNMSKAQRGHKVSEATRRKISEAGKNISEETRRKMSKAARNRKKK